MPHAPRLVLISGEPGSGKSTLGRRLSAEARLPFIARDDVRGGLAHGAGAWSEPRVDLPSAVAATESFLDIVTTLLSAEVSCVVEYIVRTTDGDRFERLRRLADVRVIVTSCDDAPARFADRHRNERLVAQPAVLTASGHADVESHTSAAIVRMAEVTMAMQHDFAVPTLHVDTVDGYQPDLDTIIQFATGR